MTQEHEVSTSGSLSLPNPDLALPTDLTRDYLIGKCEYFSSIGIWPNRTVLDPERWLDNFLDEEVDHALYLLNAFMYFAPTLVDQIFSSSIRIIGRMMTRDQWEEFSRQRTCHLGHWGEAECHRQRSRFCPEGKVSWHT